MTTNFIFDKSFTALSVTEDGRRHTFCHSLLWQLRVEKAKKVKKINTKAKQKSSMPNLAKKTKKAKKPNQKLQGQDRSKKAKFDLFGLA